MRQSERQLEGKCAWVTGASRGIGRAIAIGLARAGAVVCAGARSEDQLRQLQDIMKSEGHTLHGIALDVAEKDSVRAFAEKATAAAGPPAILVNNAGLGLFLDFDRMEAADFDQQIDVTLKGPWYMAKQAVPHMRNLGSGHIINISSIAGRAAFPRGAAYNAAKAGLNLMSESLMMELREHGIKVTVVAPGSVDTSFHQASMPNSNPRDNSWMVDAETVADAVVHILTLPEKALTNYYEIRPAKPVKSEPVEGELGLGRLMAPTSAQAPMTSSSSSSSPSSSRRLTLQRISGLSPESIAPAHLLIPRHSVILRKGMAFVVVLDHSSMLEPRPAGMAGARRRLKSFDESPLTAT